MRYATILLVLGLLAALVVYLATERPPGSSCVMHDGSQAQAGFGRTITAEDLERHPELLRPVSRDEVEELLRALEPQERDEGRPAGRALRSSAGMPPQRLGVVLYDVKAAWVSAHMDETAARLATRDDIPPRNRAVLQATIEALQACTRNRFQERGGDEAFNRTREFVELFREQLDRILRDALRLPIPPPPVFP